MNRTDQIAEQYVTDTMELDPIWAAAAGITGFEDRMADLSPDGFQVRADLDRRTIAALRAVAATSERWPRPASQSRWPGRQCSSAWAWPWSSTTLAIRPVTST